MHGRLNAFIVAWLSVGKVQLESSVERWCAITEVSVLRFEQLKSQTYAKWGNIGALGSELSFLLRSQC